MDVTQPEDEYGGADAIGGIKVAMLVILRSTNEIDWEPVMSPDVPAAIKDPDVLARMLDGEMTQIEGDAYWWRAINADEPIEGVKLRWKEPQ